MVPEATRDPDYFLGLGGSRTFAWLQEDLFRLATLEEFMTLEEFGLPPGSSKEQLRRAFVERCKGVDPRTHREEFERLRDAYLRGVKFIEARRCETCGGVGTVVQYAGFHAATVVCPVCLGRKA